MEKRQERFEKAVWMSVVILLAVITFAQVLLAQTDTMMGQPAMPQVETMTRLPYNIAPPRSITVEFNNPELLVDLNGQGKLQLTGSLPQAGSVNGYSAVIGNVCTHWTMWHPYNSTIYHFHPNPPDSQDPALTYWTNYALRLEVPDLDWYPNPAPSAYIIQANDFSVGTATKYALDPAVKVELGPQGMMGSQQFPNLAKIRFPKAYLEWFRSTGEGRLRAGNIVLASLGGYWDDKRINVFHISWRFIVDLNTMVVYYLTDDRVEHPTLLKVTIDDSPEDVFYFEPDIWW